MAQEKRALRFAMRAAEGAKFALAGRAITYNDETEIPCSNGSFLERVAPGALDGVLGSGAEIKALFNHNADSVLGSRKNGTLSLTSNDKALSFAVALDKKNAKHQEVYAMVQRGDIDGCSFNFVPEDEDWENVRDSKGNLRARRTLKKININEISVVTFPAYNNTMVQARSVDYSAQIRKAMTTPPVMHPDVFLAYAKKRAAEIEYEILRSAPAYFIDDKTGTVYPDFRSEDERNRAKCDSIGREIYSDLMLDNLED
jgi:HK97 family phage prohead protease